jgi:lambda repressor-like predicted transcriptional regulator
MPMTFRQRKAALAERGVPQAAIARKTGFSEPYVHQVLKGERRSEPIEQLVAQVIGIPRDEVFEPLAPTPDPDAALEAAIAAGGARRRK